MDEQTSKRRAVGILVFLFSILVLAGIWNLPEDESATEKYTDTGFRKAA